MVRCNYRGYNRF